MVQSETKFIIFWFNKLPENKESGNREENIKDPQDFPTSWNIWTVDSYTVLFETAKLAEDYLSLQLTPNYLYRIVEWKVTLNHKVFSPCSKLVEVDEI